MKTSIIKILLWPVILILCFFVYNSISSEIKFQKKAKLRISENVQKLKDLRTLQIAYKKVNNEYADNFKTLLDFYYNGTIPIIKAVGENLTDSLSDDEAIELGIISRDTTYVPAKDVVFNNNYLESRNNEFQLNIKMLNQIPYTNLEYNIDAGIVDKGKVSVHVFEISASFKNILNGLNAKNKNFDLEKLLKVGSMTEASLNGNWGE